MRGQVRRPGRATLLAEPVANVADDVPDATPDPHSAGPGAFLTPLVERLDGNAEILREFLDADQRASGRSALR